MRGKILKILKIIGIVLLIIAIFLACYILICGSVTAFDAGAEITEQDIISAIFIDPETNNTINFYKNTLYIYDKDSYSLSTNMKIAECIVKYDVFTEDKAKTYYIKFITKDKIYSTQLNAYLYRW